MMSAEQPFAGQQYRHWALACELFHPNLLPVHAVGRAELDGDSVVYALTDVPDENLGQVIPSRALTPEEAQVALESMASCLDYLHGKNLRHGKVELAGVVAVGNDVKLTSDSVFPASVTDLQREVYEFGATLVEMLTQKRPPSQNQATGRPDRDEAVRRLPPPFREVAIGCMQRERRWEIGDALRALTTGALPAPEAEEVPDSAVPVDPAPAGENRRLGARAAVVAIGAATLLIGFFNFTTRREETPPAAQPVQTTGPESRPSPTANQPTVFPPTPKVEAPPPAERVPDTRTANRAGSEWAVVAAIYRDYDAAQRRANSVKKRWPQFEPHVFPAKGKGSKYMVVVGSGLEKDNADRLRQQARQAGLPSDTYVTKLLSAQ
jgi:hypothetical protein